MKDWFLDFSETPVGRIVAIGVFALFCVVYIMSYTSVGKKALIELRSRADRVDKKLKDKEKELEEQRKKFEEEQNKKIALLEQKCNKYEEFICGTLKYINNKKVKESIKKFELDKKLTTTTEKVAE